MLKVLDILPYPIVPVTSGGKVRITSIGQGLSEHGLSVDFLTPFVLGQRRIYRQLGSSLPLRQIPYPLIWALLADRPLPYQYLTSFHPGLPLFSRPFLRGYDIVMMEHTPFSSLLPCVPSSSKIVYSAHNVEFDYVAGECRHLPPWLRTLVTERIRRLEQRMIERADSVLVVSKEDARRFQELYSLPDHKTFLAPNGVQDQIKQGSRDRLKARLFSGGLPEKVWIFSGSDVAHNRDAVQQLLVHFVPRMKETEALVIHGQVSRYFRDRSLSPQIVVDSGGEFEDFSEIDAIGLNPVRLGSGTNLKLLHYLDHGLRTVTTPFGLRGLETLRPYVLSVPVEEFWEAANSCLPAPPKKGSLQRQFGWSRISKSLAEHLVELSS